MFVPMVYHAPKGVSKVMERWWFLKEIQPSGKLTMEQPGSLYSICGLCGSICTCHGL